MLIALFVAVAFAQPAPCQSTHGAADVESFARALADAVVKKDLAAVDVLMVDECALQDARFRLRPKLADSLEKLRGSDRLPREFEEAAARVIKDGLAPVGEFVFFDRDPYSFAEGRSPSIDAFFKAGSAWRKLDFQVVRIGARWYLADDDFDLRDGTLIAPSEYWVSLFEPLINALDTSGDPGATFDTWWSKHRATLEQLAPQIQSLTGSPRRRVREPYLWVLRMLGNKAAALDARLTSVTALYGEPVTLARPFGDVACDPFYGYAMRCFVQATVDVRGQHQAFVSLIDDCSNLHVPADGKCPDAP